MRGIGKEAREVDTTGHALGAGLGRDPLAFRSLADDPQPRIRLAHGGEGAAETGQVFDGAQSSNGAAYDLAAAQPQARTAFAGRHTGGFANRKAVTRSALCKEKMWN